MEATLPMTGDLPGTLRIEDAGGGILAVVFDTGDHGPPFVLSEATLAELAAALEKLAAAAPRGVLFRSAHPAVFCAGADVDAMAAVASPAAAEALVKRGQDLFERIATLPFPAVALIHGTCVGGGFELALACAARTATPDPATRIGLPEVKLGILPAWGGSTRLPRLVGLSRAVPLITAGRTLNGLGALKAGLVDSVVPREHLVREGVALVEKLRKHEPVRRPDRSSRSWFLDRTPVGRMLVESLAKKAILAETKGFYPAPLAALRVLSEGATVSVATSLGIERREVLGLLQTPAHKNLLRLFQITRESRRPAIYRAGKDAPRFREVAVLGAGTMGAGIAALLARSGFAVRVIDPVPAALARARKLAVEEIRKLVGRKDLSRAEGARQAARLSFSTSVDGLRAMDLVIEAAPEKRELKEKLLAQAAALLKPGAILATNTSSFPVGELAAAVADPSRFVGLHFFNPPLKMPLLEIIRGPATSDAAVAAGLRLAAECGKTPIVVGDGPGFLVNRLLAPYFMEACRAAQEGVPVPVIDRAITDFGLPMGPFRLMDEVGLDIILDASRHMAAREGFGFAVHPFVEALVQQGRLGRKSGEGFYAYRKRDFGKRLGPSFARIVKDFRRPGADPGQEAEAVRERLIGRMVAEARRVLGEGLVLAPEDVDIGTVFGIGYPAFRGGLLHDAASAPPQRAAGERKDA